MTITAAEYWSKDEYRIKYVEDGVEKKTRRDKPEYDVVKAAITVTPFVHVTVAGLELHNEITGEFWRRVALNFGVSVDRAKTHIAINGAPAAVVTLWTKATALMDGNLTRPDITDDSRWT